MCQYNFNAAVINVSVLTSDQKTVFLFQEMACSEVIQSI